MLKSSIDNNQYNLMKKSSKIRSVKTLILSQLLLGSLCISAYAEWDYRILAEAQEFFSAHNHPEGANAVQAIDRYTSATLVTANDALRRINQSSLKAKDSAQLRAQIERVAREAADIQSRIARRLTALEPDPNDLAALGILSEDLELEAQDARTNFIAALDSIHHIQQTIDTKSPYRQSCLQ
jgi:hypothetical protein